MRLLSLIIITFYSTLEVHSIYKRWFIIFSSVQSLLNQNLYILNKRTNDIVLCKFFSDHIHLVCVTNIITN